MRMDREGLAKKEKVVGRGAYDPRDAGNVLAYTTDNTGFRQYRLHVRDLRTGKDLTDTAEKVGSNAWANDNQTLFYTVEEEKTKRQYRLYRHKLGADSAKDDLVYEEPDERFNIGVQKSRSGKYLFLEIGSHTTSEVRYLDASKPKDEWKLIAPRQQDLEYYADHLGDKFYIRTNDKGRNFRLVAAPANAPGKENWKEVLPARADVRPNDFQPFQVSSILDALSNELPELTVVSLATGEKKRITYPEPVYTRFPQVNREYKTK